MKFYYNNQLIRTSKTHHYKYAVLYNGKCEGCTSRYDLALNKKNEAVKKHNESIEFFKKMVEARKQGLKEVSFVNIKLKVDEKYDGLLEKALNDEIKIVELEER